MKLKELVNINIGLALERKKSIYTGIIRATYNALNLKSFDNPIKLKDNSTEQFYAAEKISEKYFTKYNNVIVRLRYPIRAIYIAKNSTQLLVSSLMAKVTLIYPNLLNAKYLAYFLNSAVAQSQINKNMQGTAIQAVRIADLLELELNLPSIEQQMKIVNFLDLATQEISLLHELIEQRSLFKNWVFQTLLSQN